MHTYMYIYTYIYILIYMHVQIYAFLFIFTQKNNASYPRGTVWDPVQDRSRVALPNVDFQF